MNAFLSSWPTFSTVLLMRESWVEAKVEIERCRPNWNHKKYTLTQLYTRRSQCHKQILLYISYAK